MSTEPPTDDPILIARKYFDQALTYYERGDLEKAVESYNEAMRIAPQLTDHFKDNELKELVESFSRLFFDTIIINADLRESIKRGRSFQRQFLINFSDEFRTHSKKIVEYSATLLNGTDGPLNNSQIQKLTSIQEIGQELYYLGGDLLDNLGDPGELEFDYFAIAPYLELTKSIAQDMKMNKPINILLHIEADLPDVWSERYRVRGILTGLIANAVKFTQEGTISISAIHIEKQESPMIQISIADTGIGIPIEQQTKIFEPFYRRNYRIKDANLHGPLKLIDIRTLVELLGGTLWIDSPPPGFNTMFSFTIPTRNPNENEPIK